MAFGITRAELNVWKKNVLNGETSYLTHYWHDPRFPGITTVTKVGNADLDQLKMWCLRHGLNPRYIHNRPPFPHYDLMGTKQMEILRKEKQEDHILRFKLDRMPLDL
ncbi:hypothetical protein [Paenibacillus nasutitermitis]|uniref:Uncharacterized protein n=1 Tax=Paenibacillus nasutitermitis TaxID=1652958 RepID=A0A916YIB1_9BACL|nr:hypothetical protein [Paenibacillus nasutitermitis]GGD46946.1 hypothetical protein GCM10010911_00570 [Paenibacillus nasutitermitis]